jgi:inhibitor of KinA
LKKPKIEPLGDAAAYVEFSETLDLEANAMLPALAARIRARNLPWIRDAVPALAGISLHFDPDALPPDPMAEVARVLEQVSETRTDSDAPARLIEVPVCYDPHFALDLVEVSGQTGVAPEDVARLHAAREHRVLMVGFSPGQPYLGGLEPKLAVPRRATPRIRVPAGSVAIANLQTAVYPFEIAGGWSVIGRTPLVLFDPVRDPPSLFAPGDRVRFVPISRADYERLR